MKRKWAVLLGASAALAVFAAGGVIRRLAGRPHVQTANQTDERGAKIWPNGWRTTAIGKFVNLPGDMPATILPLPDGRRAVVNTCGYHDHSVSLIDLGNGAVLDSVTVPRLWIGLSYDPATHEVLVSAGSGKDLTKHKKRAKNVEATTEPEMMLHYRIDGDKLVSLPGVTIPGIDQDDWFVSGIARTQGDLIVANIQTDMVYRVSPDGANIKASAKTGYRPYGVALSPDEKTVAVSNWGDGNVSLLDAATLKEQTKIPVGSHPNALTYIPDGRLFVANAGSDTLSVLTGDRVTETIRTSISARDPIGAAPIGLAYAKDQSRLYVANSDNNSVAVVDIKTANRSRLLGFIPTGRYPSAVALTNDGKQLLVGTAKGLSSAANAGPAEAAQATMQNDEKVVPGKYVGNILSGDLAIIDLPEPDKLAAYTKEVVENRPDGRLRLKTGQTPGLLSALKKIEHIVYVIKENRTYDQVLGDDPRGNGEADMVMYGQNVTPNEHKIAKDFVLFDNLYTDGEVSQVGHQWTDAAYAGDYTEKQWTLSYGGHEEVDSDTRLSSSPGGYIWQNAQKHGKTTRIYGEYLQWQEDHSSAHGEVKEDPEKFGCSAAFEEVFARGGRDTEKVAVFLNELKQAEQSGKWPNFMVMALPEDHTKGMKAGAFTPQAMVGSNDLAIGQLIEGISHSRFWPTTAVFIIEDDAQDGPDHVDCHRTTGFLVCPLVKRGTVDHTMYSTSSMVRTIELMLGLPPLSQYDANAMPMLPCLSAKADLTAYDSLPPGVDLMKKCPAKGALAMRSAKLDFSDVDKCDPQELNDILWKNARPGTRTPAPVHGLIR